MTKAPGMGKQVLWIMFLALLSWREAMEGRHLQATAAMFNLGTDLDRWGMSPKPFPKERWKATGSRRDWCSFPLSWLLADWVMELSCSQECGRTRQPQSGRVKSWYKSEMPCAQRPTQENLEFKELHSKFKSSLG